MKICFKCSEEKELSEFYPHKQMADGHLNKCRSCTRRDVSEHRAGNLSAVREYDRNRSSLPHRREKNRVITAAWRKANPERRAAQHALNSAVRSGKVVPWPVCAMYYCDVTKVEAHHPDYSRPLDVVWLCSPHHKQAHAETKRSQ